jgi:S-formylglutathione hydrolase FrmB
MRSLSIIFLFVSIFQIGCDQSSEKILEAENETKNESPQVSLRKDTSGVFVFRDREFDFRIVRTKRERIGTILALPGWNYPYNHWIDSTDLCELATKKGYDILMPSMGKTIYSEKIYPQTRDDWKNELTRTWINDSLIPMFQKECQVLIENEQNAIIGVSTGGRGAVLLAMDNAELFSSGASLSGDFDMLHFQEDNLYKGFFGDFENHKAVWVGEENPSTRSSELDLHFLFVHGENDKIVPAAHSRIFHSKLNDVKSILKVVPNEGHDYDFWNSQLTEVIEHIDNSWH